VGIRETLNRNPAVTTGATIALIVIAVVVIVWQLMPARGGSAGPTKAYYSVDDGKTWFADDYYCIPPYQHDGKEAVRAHVYQVGEGKAFVGWLEKYKDDVKPKLEKALAGKRQGPLPAEFMDDSNRMIKKPGAANKWQVADFQIMSSLRNFQTPEGYAREIFPTEKE